ncbi:sensor histidine kinase [Parapedobacter sp. GCM10030251]|uniref:sensor histidine kinase n=1 Tax=Parapedobacter sp. GCM10030251 TaxID=3273419 RepID=UPI0036146377
MLQPLVENALKHAIEPSLEGGQVDIVCRLYDNKAHIRISNTGNPYKGDIADIFAESRIGLSNTAKRLFYHFGEELTVEQSPSGGLRVSFYIPF